MSSCLLFFQAEDGIRDGHVTGVQTCALPISTSPTTRTNNGSPSTSSSWAPTCGNTTTKASTTGSRSTRTETARPALSEIGRASCREREKMWMGAMAGQKEEKRRTRKKEAKIE